MEQSNKNFFLRGGGEMGQLTQAFNWAGTPVGPIEQWPPNLRNAIGIILQSAFPMLLFWGRDFTAFYNDPYSEILKSGDRHPALGKRAADIWPEGWEAVRPLIEKVYYEGEAVYFEDQLIPVFRHGQMEDVYWTFKYSPFYGTDDNITGVIISCSETTEKVRSYKQLQESKEELEFAIEATELGVWELNPATNKLKANSRLKNWFGLSPEEEMPLNTATEVIIEEDRQRVIDAIQWALQYESGGYYNIEYTIQHPLTGTRKIVHAKGRSWFNDDKVAYRFNGTLQDITDQVMSRKKIEESELRFRSLVEETTVATAILTGSDFILELANDSILDFWQRDRSVLGKPLLEFMPELKNQAFPNLLSNVLTTGEPYFAEEAPAIIERNGKLEDAYVDFSYKALRDETGAVKSVLVMAIDVTEKVLAKKRIMRSEENLRNTILKAPVAMAIFKGDDFIAEIANNKMLALWGKTAGEIIGKPTLEVLPEVKKQGIEEILQDIYKTGKSFSAQGIPVEFSGKKAYVNFVFEAYRDSNGGITGIILVATDVTEQVTARKKLEQSEERVRALVQSAPFPIAAYYGEEMRIELANQSIMDIWGKGNDVIGKLYTEVLPELSNQKVFEQLESVYNTGIAFHAKNERLELIVDNKPRPYYFNYSFTPLFDAAGKVYGVMNTGADVTDLNLAKQKVEQSEKNFRNMILQAPVAMCILLGPEHIVDIANDYMVELWGKNRDDVMNKPIWEAVPDARDQGLEQLMEHVYTHGETFSAYERPVELLRNGKWETVYQNFVYQPYKDSSGEVLGVLAISVDVSQQVLARQKIEDIVQERTLELEEANNNLKKSNDELAQFAYITSHDLQEPVRKISIFTNMLENTLGTIEERPAGYINKIKASAERMTTLIKDVLLYSQVSTQQQNFERVELEKVIADTLTDFELVIEQRNASVNYNGLPVVEAIALQMAQLFGNLMSNSLKYTLPEVSPVITITSSVLPKEEVAEYTGLDSGKEYFKIEFRDNGIGFKPEYADKIFNIFQRLHTKSEYSGTGIGLAMCKKIVENHHGDIKAAPHPDGGAVFTIVLPVKQ